MQIANMPSADPMLSVIARRSQRLSVRRIPTIASSAKQGTKRRVLWEGSDGFPDGFPRKALERVTSPMQDEVMIERLDSLSSGA